MPDLDFIASRRLLAIAPSGREFELTTAIGQPYEASSGEWACPVRMDGLHDRLRDAHGVDSWQAFQLAQQLIAQLLTYFVEDGGKLFWIDTREPIDLGDLFPKLP